MTKRSNIKNTEQVVRSTKPLITPDWTGTQGMTPFYDYERKMYVVAVSLKYETIALWFLPFIFFMLGIYVIYQHNKKSKKFK